MGQILSTLCCNEYFENDNFNKNVRYSKLPNNESEHLEHVELYKISPNSESLFIVNGVYSKCENYNLMNSKNSNNSELLNNSGNLRNSDNLIIPEMYITLGKFAMKIESIILEKGEVYCINRKFNNDFNNILKIGKSVFCKVLSGILKPDNYEYIPNYQIGYKPQYVNRNKYDGTVYNFFKSNLKEFTETYHFYQLGYFDSNSENSVIFENSKTSKNLEISQTLTLGDNLKKFELFKKIVLIPLGIPEIYNKRISNLSEYEWTLLTIISTIGNLNLELYIIDEFIWLNNSERSQIANTLKEFANKFNKTVLIVETNRSVYLDNYKHFIKIDYKGDITIVKLE